MRNPAKRQRPRRKTESRSKSNPKTTRRKRVTTTTPARPAARARENLTDLGNARRFIRVYGKSVRHVPGVGWLVWTSKRWKRDELGEVMRFAKGTVERIPGEAGSASDGKLVKSLRTFSLRCCYRARWMREKWARASRQNDGEAPGRGKDSISKPGEEEGGGRVVHGDPPPRVRVRPRQHS